MLTNEEIIALGFTTRGVYQGPFDLPMAAELMQSLVINKDSSGKLIFGRLVIVAQGDGFNIVEIVDQIVLVNP